MDIIYRSKDTRAHVVFSKEEEILLKKLVQKHGTSNWQKISNQMPKRNKRQVRDRWNNFLDPYLNKALWTEEEEKFLIKTHSQLGNKWKLISTFFPGRTDVDMKKTYYRLERRHKKKYGKRIKLLPDLNDIIESEEKEDEEQQKVEEYVNEENENMNTGINSSLMKIYDVLYGADSLEGWFQI